MSKDSTGEGAEKGGPRKRAVRLASKKDARRLIGQAVNYMLRGEIGAERGRAIVFAASVFIKSLEFDESKWAASESQQPSPAMIASKIRECMRMADAQVPGPPGAKGGDG